jgi:hypothetical protein
MKIYLSLGLLTFAATVIAPLHAVTHTFDTATDYTNNFTNIHSSTNTALAWDAGTVLQSGTSNGASIAYYNTPLVTPDFTLQVDARLSAITNLSANSVGLLTQVSGNTGYATIFRINSATTADVRIFEGGAYATGSVGTQSSPNSTITLTGGNTFSVNTFYTFKLDVLNTGTAITFTTSILTTGGTLLGTFTSFTDTTPTNVTATGLGIRQGIEGNQQTRLDNFVLTTSAIPEPSTYAFLGGASVLGLAVMTRRKRR